MALLGRHNHVLLLLLLLLQLGWAIARDQPGDGGVDEMNLINYLFKHKGYNPLIRPVANLSGYVIVKLELAMIQLIHVEEKNQIMKSNVWIRMAWNDYQLQWDISDFGGIKVIRVSPKKVWKPDIVLFNNADGKYEVSWQPNILIHSNGEILWIPPSIYKSSCTIDVTYFPFDQQECEMKFGSWTFDASQVVLGWYNVGKNNVDLTNYWKSGTWDIVDCPGRISNISKPGQRRQTELIYKILLRRKTLFYTVNLIIPCVLISFLSVCVFYLPADAGEKMTLCISILFALVVFQLLVSKILPPTSKTIPLISTFLLFTFIMNIVTITITVIIINWNFRTPRTHKMPPWVKVIFMRYLPLILFMKRPDHIVAEERQKRRLWQATGGSFLGLNTTEATISAMERQRQRRNDCNGGLLMPPRTATVTSISGGRLIASDDMEMAPFASSSAPLPPPPHYAAATAAPTVPVCTGAKLHHPKCKLHHQRGAQIEQEGSVNGDANGMPMVGPTAANEEDVDRQFITGLRQLAGVELTEELRQAVSAINFISTHLQVEDEYKRVLEDWKYVASVIDRVHLVIFVSVTIVGTIVILMNAPYILEYVDQDEIKRKYSSED